MAYADRRDEISRRSSDSDAGLSERTPLIMSRDEDVGHDEQPLKQSLLRLEPKTRFRKHLIIYLAVFSGVLLSYLIVTAAVPQVRTFNPFFAIVHAVAVRHARPFASIRGPLIHSNFADPAIFYQDGVSYAFATNNRKPAPNFIHIQVATSSDNETWTLEEKLDAMPSAPPWGTGNRTWAPDVIRLDNGKFVLYFCDELRANRKFHCIGAAVSDTVAGPYVPGAEPLACPDTSTLGGAIDPEGFQDPDTGKRYVLYKVDGNSLGHGGLCNNAIDPIMPTPLLLQEVSPDDGTTLIGEPVQIFDRATSDGPLIEAPALHRSKEGIYFLFFSSSCFTTPNYDVDYATSTNVTGPYTRTKRPLLLSGDGPRLVGPGGLDIIPGGDMVVFHGQLTIENDPVRRQQAEEEAKRQKKTINDVSLPMVRGMYSGVAKFDGHLVTLANS